MQEVKVQVGLFDEKGKLLGISAPFRVSMVPHHGQLEMHPLGRPYLIIDKAGKIADTRVNFYGLWFRCGVNNSGESVEPGNSVDLVWDGPMATIEDLSPR